MVLFIRAGPVEQPKGVIFSCSNEKLARSYHKGIKEWSLCRLEADLSVAYLIDANGPVEMGPTEEEKQLHWSGYAYKSLLTRASYPKEIRCEGGQSTSRLRGLRPA